MEGMKTISVADSHAIHRLIADLRGRLPHTDHHADRALLQRCLATFTGLVATSSPPPDHSPLNAEKVAARLGGGPDLAAAIESATSSLGPYFRLVSASKTVDCPRCKRPTDAKCDGPRLCDERTWAYAAQRRRDKRPLPQANIDAIRSALYTGAPSALATAIKHGLVRLELCTNPDGAPEVQWVDAV
jgi:hypothetical protein